MNNPYETSVYDRTADWRARAACVNNDPEMFFPGTGSAKSTAKLDQAKVVCSTCVVREACLRWAIRTGTNYGVWGGANEDERRTLRRTS